jgi:hypothetical protein
MAMNRKMRKFSRPRITPIVANKKEGNDPYQPADLIFGGLISPLKFASIRVIRGRSSA